jgi:hypothetical protein
MEKTMQLSSSNTHDQPKLSRANRTTAQIKNYVEGFKASGLTMTEFCNNHQLAISTFSKWFNNSLSSGKKFTPIVVAQALRPTPEPSPQEHVTLDFKGVITLTFSNMKTSTLIVDIVKGLT